MKDKVVLLGAGGHCKVVIDILGNSCEIAGITDIDPDKHGKIFHGYKVLGDDNILRSLYLSGIKKALVTLGSVGDSSARKKLFYCAKKNGFEMFNAISVNAILSDSVRIGEGNIIMDGSIIHADTIIENNIIINTGSIVEHDCVIEDHVHISPGACLGGGVRVREGTHVGLGACVIQDITIGRNCVIGAGAVVINDIPDNCVAAGVPARIIKKAIGGSGVTADEIRKLLINSDASIKHAIKTIDDAAKGIALAVDEDLRLRGTITDGDVRRAILKGISLDSPVKSIMNENFTFVTKNCSRLLVENIFQQKSILQIPVLDDHMRVVDVIFYSDFFKKPCKENQAVIMAGGLGTRLSPLTREIPKPMLQVGAKPILETIIDQLKSYGYKNIIICLNYKAGVIKNYFRDGSDFGVFIKYINEEKRLGTAGAIRLAKKYLDKPFFVINGDILTKLNFEQFMQFHIKMNNAITIGTKKYEMEIPYGVVDIKDESVISICEKPTLDFFVSGGLYCLNPETLEHIPENEYFDITQLISSYIQANNKVGSFPITEYWMDIGQMEDYRRANMDYESKFRSDRCAVVK